MSSPMLLNQTNAIKDKYNVVNSLRNINACDEAITIEYNKLDTITAGQLKEKISQALNEYEAAYRDKMTVATKKYIKQLQQLNACSKFTIEYKKFENDMIARQFREAIQFVFINRCRELYLSMTLNPTM